MAKFSFTGIANFLLTVCHDTDIYCAFDYCSETIFKWSNVMTGVSNFKFAADAALIPICRFYVEQSICWCHTLLCSVFTACSNK